MAAAPRGGLLFGVYPGSATGDDAGRIVTGPPDVPRRIDDALDELQGPAGRAFAVRAYRIFTDPADSSQSALPETPAGFGRYLGRGRVLDLVAQYHSAAGDVPGYCAFLEELVDSYGDRIGSLQVGEEPNVTGNPSLDGWYPRVTEAIVSGVAAAKARARRFPGLTVGINTTPLAGPGRTFLAELTAAGRDRFIASLDYVGLDFFPDVFRPVPVPQLSNVVAGLLADHRGRVLAPAGLGHLPLVITEHGWPTGPGRPPGRQAQVLSAVVETIVGHAAALNITGYSHFALRDACTARTGLFCQFGLMTDDYAPKPAFGAYRDLIRSCGRQ
ncbi:MAG TPA: hypothetical protein VH637_18185 [Streptosporangiaceae bacterium]|jgi:hypothetical protein